MRSVYRIDQLGLYRQMREAQRAARSGREVCGLLVDCGGYLRLVPVRNATRDLGRFELVPSWWRAGLRANGISADRIAGTYHSHPASPAEPGQSDIARAWDRTLMLIIASWGERVRLWEIRGETAYGLGWVRRAV